MPRELTYAQAINEAQAQAMELCKEVLILGQLADTPAGIFGTTTGLAERFGSHRVQDFPVSENLMTAVAMGASLTGMRPVLVHQRLDFMIYSLDAIVNWMSLWRFKSNGKSNMAVTIRAIVGKGWGQGPQHSKSLHAWFAHLPGIRVAMPSTAYDAKGLLLESIFSEIPAIFIEGRTLFSMKTHVPDQPYRIAFGHAAIRRGGTDATVVAIGMMVPLVLRAATELAEEGINLEVIDLRTVSPWDKATVIESAARTRRLLVVDPAWRSFSVSAEVIATVAEEIGQALIKKPVRLCLPDSHTPMSSALERLYYPAEREVKDFVRKLVA